MTAVAKEVAAISYAHYTATSIANYLLSDVFGKRPKLVHKNTKAAAFEATEMAAETEAAARMEDIKRLAAEYEAMDCGAGTEALAQAAKQICTDRRNVRPSRAPPSPHSAQSMNFAGAF